VWDPAIEAGHRVQEALLDRNEALKRATRYGAEEAWVRLQPYRRKMKQARMFRQYPWRARIYCIPFLAGSWIRYLSSYLAVPPDRGFVRRLDAISRTVYYRELLRASARLDDYRLGGKKLSQPSTTVVDG